MYTAYVYLYIFLNMYLNTNKKYLNLETNSNKVVRCIRGSMLQILKVFYQGRMSSQMMQIYHL